MVTTKTEAEVFATTELRRFFTGTDIDRDVLEKRGFNCQDRARLIAGSYHCHELICAKKEAFETLRSCPEVAQNESALTRLEAALPENMCCETVATVFKDSDWQKDPDFVYLLEYMVKEVGGDKRYTALDMVYAACTVRGKARRHPQPIADDVRSAIEKLGLQQPTAYGPLIKAGDKEVSITPVSYGDYNTSTTSLRRRDTISTPNKTGKRGLPPTSSSTGKRPRRRAAIKGDQTSKDPQPASASKGDQALEITRLEDMLRRCNVNESLWLIIPYLHDDSALHPDRPNLSECLQPSHRRVILIERMNENHCIYVDFEHPQSHSSPGADPVTSGKEREILVFDPLHSREVFDEFKVWFKDWITTTSWLSRVSSEEMKWTSIGDSLQQEDDCDCYIYCVAVAIYRMAGESLPDTIHPELWRYVSNVEQVEWGNVLPRFIEEITDRTLESPLHGNLDTACQELDVLKGVLQRATDYWQPFLGDILKGISQLPKLGHKSTVDVPDVGAREAMQNSIEEVKTAIDVSRTRAKIQGKSAAKTTSEGEVVSIGHQQDKWNERMSIFKKTLQALNKDEETQKLVEKINRGRMVSEQV